MVSLYKFIGSIDRTNVSLKSYLQNNFLRWCLMKLRGMAASPSPGGNITLQPWQATLWSGVLLAGPIRISTGKDWAVISSVSILQVSVKTLPNLRYLRKLISVIIVMQIYFVCYLTALYNLLVEGCYIITVMCINDVHLQPIIMTANSKWSLWF